MVLNQCNISLSHQAYIGVWLYHFLERVLIPTGLHHFIYAPIEVGPVVAKDGLKAEWFRHLNEFAESSKPLKRTIPLRFHGYKVTVKCLCYRYRISNVFYNPKANRKKLLRY